MHNYINSLSDYKTIIEELVRIHTVFDVNNAETRGRLYKALKNVLPSDLYIVCDERNNTDDMIAQGEFAVHVFEPANYRQLEVFVSRHRLMFDEVKDGLVQSRQSEPECSECKQRAYNDAKDAEEAAAKAALQEHLLKDAPKVLVISKTWNTNGEVKNGALHITVDHCAPHEKQLLGNSFHTVIFKGCDLMDMSEHFYKNVWPVIKAGKPTVVHL